jgi:hypothetical protein
MGFELIGDNKYSGWRARCDRCGRVDEGPIPWGYPASESQRQFCYDRGWVNRKGILLCGSCWADLLPEYPPWAMPGRYIRSVEVWCKHPVGTLAVVQSQGDTHGPSGELRRIIHIRPVASDARWGGNLWLDQGDHLKWEREPVERPSRWVVLRDSV